MITRIWRGWTTLQNATAYQTLLLDEIFPGIANRLVPGYSGISLLRRDLDDEVEFVTIMKFDSIASVKAFAGENYELAVVPPKARALLARFDERSAHYETIFPPAWDMIPHSNLTMFTSKFLAGLSLISLAAVSPGAIPSDYLGTPFDDAGYRARTEAQSTNKADSHESFSPALVLWEGHAPTRGEGWVGKTESAASIGLDDAGPDGTRLIHYRNSGSGHFSIFGWNWASPAESPANLEQFDAVSFSIKITGPKKMAELYVGFTDENPTPVSLRAYDPQFADGEWHTISIPLRDFRWNLLGPKTDRTEARGLVFMTYLWDKSDYEILLDHLALGRSTNPEDHPPSKTQTVAKTAQHTGQAIPGRVECAFFDVGGEGVAYHDTDPINVLSGVLNQQKNHQRPNSAPYYWNFRKDEGVDISYTKDFADFSHPNLAEPPENQLYIGSASDGEWCNYTVDVKKPGRYKIIALYGNEANAFTLSLNHQPPVECKFPLATGGMHKWNKAEVGSITFPEAGPQLLTFSYNKGNNFAYFDFELIEEQPK